MVFTRLVDFKNSIMVTLEKAYKILNYTYIHKTTQLDNLKNVTVASRQ